MAKSESLRLNQALRQQQTLAPVQLQYVKMLEMNGPEVEEEIRRAIDENPALEVTDNDSGQHADDFNETAEEMQLADYRSDDDIPSYRLEAANRSTDQRFYEPEAVEGGDSLMESLLLQLSENKMATPEQMEIARYIAGNIDSNGYMTRTLRSIADDITIETGSDVSSDEVRKVWNMIRALEPAGVGAVDLRDSLLLQLKRLKQDADTVTATEIVRDYFDLFSLRHYKQLCSMLGIDDHKLRKAIDVIRKLNPKPGALISGSETDSHLHITPDFLVEADGDTLTLTLLNNIPSLGISGSFSAETEVAPRRQGSESANLFIKQRRDEAANFIRALSMRQETLYRVMAAIMQWQREFFLTDDPSRLRPMILKDISEKTGYGISAVSRATAGKYVATARGVYPLRFFFNEPRDTDDLSSTSVMERIRDMVDNEDKKHPLTDDALTRRLLDEGIAIARRTVAKYREKMGIPVGRLRKQL